MPPREYFHVSPVKNVDSILVRGLLLVPPARNFNCGRTIYLANTVSAAKRWASEIAREAGHAGEYALFSVVPVGVLSGSASDDGCEIGVGQYECYANVPAANVTLVETFTAEPLPNPDRDESSFERELPATYECEFCGFTYASEDGLDTHVQETHECPECDHMFADDESFDEHLVEGTNSCQAA